MYKKLVTTVLIVILIVALAGCQQERGEPAAEYRTAAANSEKLSQLDDIADKRVGVVTGTLFDGFVAQKYPQAKISRYDSTSDMVLAVKANKLDVAIVDALSAKAVQKNNQDIGILSDNALSYPMGVGFNKNNPTLRQEFNNFLKEARSNGTYDEIYQRWFDNDPELAVMPDIKKNTRGKKLVLGVSVADLPYVAFMNGKYVGFDIEMVQNFAVQKGYNLEIATMEFASLIAALSAGKVDMIADGIGITEERSKQVDFSDSYVEGKSAVIALKENLTGNNPSTADNGSKLKSVADLKNKKIGVLLGGIHDDYARKTWPRATVMQYKSQSDLILAVKTGKVDAAFYTHESLLEMLRNDKDLAFLGQNLFRIPIAMGFNQNNDKLREQFNEFLKQSKANGVFDDMVKRWITEGKTEMPVIKNPKNNGRLVVGIVSDKGLPFAIVKNNRVVGFDIEIAERFAAYLGKELVLADMEFASLISAVAGNKIDMIDSTLVITEERAKQVDFSDPYYELGASVFTLKKNLAGYDKAGPDNSALKLDDLSDKRIGVLTGSAGEKAARERFPQAQIINLDSITNAVAALGSNKVDAVVFERTSLQNVANQYPGYELIKEPVQLLDVAIAVKKGNPLLNSVNQTITELESAGTLADMKKRWFVKGDLPAMPKLDVPEYHETLRIGTEALMPPFEFVDSNHECSGFDMELAQRIGQKLGKKVVITNMNFPSLVPALQSGKIDLAISCFNVTEERRQKVDFSKPYHVSDTAAMVIKPGETSQLSKILKNVKTSFYSNIIVEQRYLLIADGLKITIIISLFSVIFGTLLGALICWLRMTKNRFLKAIARVYISILRGIPVLVLLMIIFYVVFASVNIDPVMVAVIAFGMNFAAYVSEMFRTSIESVDQGQREAGIAGGFTSLQTFTYIILPQAVKQVLPVYKGEFISLVKMTSVVGYIAVQDLTKASDIIRSRTFDAFFPLVMVAVLYFVISWLLALALDYIGFKTDPKRNRGRGGAEA
ncbi:MAG: ABC transporter permease subunit [Syntrophomonas sp.]